MKKPFYVIPLAALLCIGFSCRQGKKFKEEVGVDAGVVGEEIRQLLKEWVEASNAGDIDRIMSLVTDKSVIIPPNAPPLIGKEAIRKDQQQSFDQYTSRGDEAVADFRVCGGFAFSRGSWATSVTPKTGGESKRLNGNFIDIYQRQPDGGWKLFWNMWSDESLVSPPQRQSPETEQIEKDIEASADALASAISRLDAEEVTRLFSNISGTNYISDGAFIPQEALSETFRKFYGSLQEMNFIFEKKEVHVFNPGMAVFTGWAKYTAVSKDGDKTDEKAIFTIVYVHADGKWSIFQAHKSLPE